MDSGTLWPGTDISLSVRIRLPILLIAQATLRFFSYFFFLLYCIIAVQTPVSIMIFFSSFRVKLLWPLGKSFGALRIKWYCFVWRKSHWHPAFKCVMECVLGRETTTKKNRKWKTWNQLCSRISVAQVMLLILGDWMDTDLSDNADLFRIRFSGAPLSLSVYSSIRIQVNHIISDNLSYRISTVSESIEGYRRFRMQVTQC